MGDGGNAVTQYWSTMKYLVKQSFASVIVGSHAEGAVIELTPEEARDLEPFIQPVAGSEIETADRLPEVETADVKSPRRKKG